MKIAFLAAIAVALLLQTGCSTTRGGSSCCASPTKTEGCSN